MSKLLNPDNKSDNVNKEQIYNEGKSEEDKTGFESSIEKPKELGKNKWLNPIDEFGKMETGREL